MSHEIVEYIEKAIEEVLDGYESRVARTAEIHPTAHISPHTWIGPDVRIGPYCVIREHVILGRGTVLGQYVEVGNAIILDNTAIHHISIVNNSFIGSNVNLGAFFVTATRKLGQNLVGEFDVLGSPFTSIRRHHGSVIGHNSELGVNVSTMPGASIGFNARIWPSSIVAGAIPSDFRGHTAPPWYVSAGRIEHRE